MATNLTRRHLIFGLPTLVAATAVSPPSFRKETFAMAPAAALSAPQMHGLTECAFHVLLPSLPECRSATRAWSNLLRILKLAGTVDALGRAAVMAPENIAHLSCHRPDYNILLLAERYGIPFPGKDITADRQEITHRFIEETKQLLVRLADPLQRIGLIQPAVDALAAYNDGAKPITHVALTGCADVYPQRGIDGCQLTDVLYTNRTVLPELPLVLDGISIPTVGETHIMGHGGSIWRTCRIIDRMQRLSRDTSGNARKPLDEQLLARQISKMSADTLAEGKDGLGMLKTNLPSRVLFPIDEVFDVRDIGDMVRFLGTGQPIRRETHVKKQAESSAKPAKPAQIAAPRKSLPLVNQFMQATALISTMQVFALPRDTKKTRLSAGFLWQMNLIG